MSPPAALEVTNLRVRYGQRDVVNIPRLSVGEGELVGIVGANGAGKSTLVNAIAGWSRAAPRVEGKVELRGEDLTALPAHLRARTGLQLVPDGKLVFDTLTVSENLDITIGRAMLAGRRVWSVDEVLDLFPRLGQRRTHLGSQLSGGERQMLGIARALRFGPSCLLLDEPSIGLAPRLVASVLQTVKALTRTGLAVVLVEQNVHAALEVVDQLVLLGRGSVITQGPAGDIRHDPRIADAYLGTQAH